MVRVDAAAVVLTGNCAVVCAENTLTGITCAGVSAVITTVLLIVAIFLISNTVSMGITVRREEIAIMKYIGAKDSFVRAPFMFEGLLIGLVGAIIPLVLLYFAYEKAVAYVMEKFSVLTTFIEFLPVSQVYSTLLPVGLALGVGIGFAGSVFTIRKHLNA
jgi:cell division transport system permease protein